MKNLYILLMLLLIAASGKSQDTWGPPFPLTDSLTDNVNATLSILPEDIIQPDTLYMLWERSSDAHSTAIYARNLTTMGGSFMVAGHINAHFNHPRVFRRGTGDTLFYFSYETDLNGNWDLYYSALLKSEVAVGPFPFMQSSQNERSLNWGSSMIFTWEKEGNIYVKWMFSDTAHVAGDSCYNPILLNDAVVAYEMALGSETGVFHSKYDNVMHAWIGPLPIDIYGTNTHLSFGNDAYSAGSVLYWQHNTGSYWTIKGFDPSSMVFYTFNNFPGCNNMFHSYTYVNMITRHSVPPLIHYSTFASDVTGNMEIYVNNVWGDTIYSNLSEYSGTDTHPQLFNDFHHYGYGFVNHLFNIWESFRGGRWQLWASNLDILTGENTLDKSAVGMITCSPNPFKEETRIVFNSRETGSLILEIYNLSGQKLKTLNTFSDGHGKYSVTWNGNDATGAPVPAGIYTCAVKTGDTVLRYKIIRR